MDLIRFVLILLLIQGQEIETSKFADSYLVVSLLQRCSCSLTVAADSRQTSQLGGEKKKTVDS